MRQLDPTALLSESDRLHRLARRLVSDPGLAADAAQEALLIGLQAGSPPGAPLGRWLAGVLRHRLRSARRAASRRQRREALHAAAQPGLWGGERSEPPADAGLERLELHQRLLGFVRELEEPFRTAVVQRFLEEQSPDEIAARLGLPVKTVYSRIERGLERLRRRLDQHPGERARWALLLLPQAPHESLAPKLRPDAPLALSFAPLFAMKLLPWCLTAAAVLLAGLTWRFFAPSQPPGEPGETSAAPPSAGAAPAGAATPLAAVSPHPERAQTLDFAAAPSPSAPPPSVALAPSDALAGRVQDIHGAGRPGLELRFEGQSAESAPLALSGAAGSFQSPWPESESRGRLRASGPGWATLWSPMLSRGRPAGELLVWVGPARRYAGLVLDGEGRPVAGARLSLTLSEELQARINPGVFQSGVAQAQTHSDAEGRFDLGELAGAPGSRLGAAAPGYRSAEIPLPEPSAEDLLLVLIAEGPRGERLAGRVLDAQGQPRPGARVGTGQHSSSSDAEGRFELELSAEQLEAAGQRLTVLAPGFLPVFSDLSGLDSARRQDLEIVLGEPAAGLSGHLRHADGRPAAGALVWTDDGTPFGRVLSEVSGMHFEVDYDIEGLIARSTSQIGGRQAACDADGAFALDGLLPQTYRLWALDPGTGELCGPFPVDAPAAGLALELAGQERPVPIAGRVTNLAGDPLPGVAILFERRRQAPDGTWVRREVRSEPPLQSDAEGRFRFNGLCIAGTNLLVERAPGDQRRIALEAQADLTDLWIALPAPCRLQVTLSEPGSAKTLQLLDAQGRPLLLTIQAGSVMLQAHAMQLDGAVSDWIETDESAAFLELSNGPAGTRRFPLRLTPNQANRLTF